MVALTAPARRAIAVIGVLSSLLLSAGPARSGTSPATTCGPSWTRVPSPNVGGGSALQAVKAIGPADVWAVGGDGHAQPLTEHWDGSAWIAVHPPSPGPAAGLISVDATGPNDVWAVGDYFDGHDYRYAEHWDGTSWTIVAMPNIPRKHMNLIRDVVAIAPGDAWAVGYHWADGQLATAADAFHWDGTAWTAVPVPAATARLTAVEATGPSDVWAAGRNGSYVPIVLRWNGTSWARIPTDPRDKHHPPLVGPMVVASTTDAWLVGTRRGSHVTQAAVVAEHWNGTTWSRTPVPDVRGQDVPTGVAAVGPDDVWIVGWRLSALISGKALGETWNWDGSRWSRLEVRPGRAHFVLYGVDALPTGEVWIVGYTTSFNEPPKTLIFQRCDG